MQTTDQFEHEMERKQNTAVIFKNIDSEDFTHTFAMIPYTIKAGEKVILTYPVAMLLAEHLAMRILRKKKTNKFAGLKGDTEKTFNLYPPTEKQELIQQIIIEQIQQPLEPQINPAERELAKVKKFQEELKDKIDEEPKKVEVTKKEIIAELLKKGIKFDPRASKESLLELITQNEMKK